MNVLVTGANGFVGRNIAAILIAAGHHVRPASRQYGIDFTDMRSPGDWLPHLRGIDAIVNAVGIIGERGRQKFASLHMHAPIALFQAARQLGIRRVIQISAIGADDVAFSAYHLSKRAADDALRSLDVDWFVLRPSLVYGRGGTSANLFMRLAKLPVIPVIGNGEQRLQPVHISDVAASVLQAITSQDVRQTIDIAGSEVFIFAEWLQRMRDARGLRRARLMPIPVKLVEMSMQAGQRLHPLLRVENLRMLQANYSADIGPLTHLLGRMPIPHEPHLFFSDALNTRNPS